MTWFFAVLIVLAMGGVAVLAAGKGAPLAEEYDDLRRVRFSLALRGYRMSEVDALLDRVASQLEQQDEHAVDSEGRGDDASP